MKVFISADIEGVNGIAAWTEADRQRGAEYTYFAARMTDEVGMVCAGVNDFDKDAYILVKDAHGSARNIDHMKLPKNVSLSRGWPGQPASMLNGLDGSFDAAVFTGYHSPAFTAGNPLAHTINSQKFLSVAINGVIAGEFHINYYAALSLGVPVVMVSGDKYLTELAEETDPDIVTVAASQGSGDAAVSKHPSVTFQELREAAKLAAGRAVGLRPLIAKKLPARFRVDITYKKHTDAYRASHFPGVLKTGDLSVAYECGRFFEFLKTWMFL